MVYAIWFFFLVVFYAGLLLVGLTLGASFIYEPLGFFVGSFFGLVVFTFIVQGLTGKHGFAYRVLISLDQNFQVVFAPLLNIGCTHEFGHEDSTASSVIGLNLRDTDEIRWKYIEFVLSWVLEGGKPHSINAIED